MKIIQETIHDRLLLSIEEERLDAHNSSEFKELVLGLIEKGNVNLIVQLKKVRFIDSSGLGALLSGLKNANARNGSFSLVGIQPQVLSMFELTRLNRVFDVYQEVEEACENYD